MLDLILLISVMLRSIIATTGCCPQKLVGGVAYELLEEGVDTKEYGCLQDCVYTSGDNRRVCFKKGSQTVKCFDNITACIDSSDCQRGEYCDDSSKSCKKGWKTNFQ